MRHPASGELEMKACPVASTAAQAEGTRRAKTDGASIARPFRLREEVVIAPRRIEVPIAFSDASTGDDVASVFRGGCQGKVVIVTGGNAGLGFETARVLASNGATVIITSRSLKNGENAVSSLNTGTAIEVMQLDLASLQSIKSFSDKFVASRRPLHILINNAGVMGGSRTLTEDGFESQFGVNHLGHFYLTKVSFSVACSLSS
jgi:hypothetical protein